MKFREFYENFNIDLGDKLYLTCGGNVVLPDGTAAEKIDITKFNEKLFEEFKTDLLKSFEDINKKYEKFSKTPLWVDFKKLTSNGKIFSGSTRSFFTKPLAEFVKFKKSVGDMDIQVPESCMPKLKEFLVSHTKKMFGVFEFSGFTNNGTQYNGLLKAPEKYSMFSKFIQIDFEGTPYEGNEPTEFATFGHYSSWTDIENGIKGLFIKYLMRSISAGIKKEKVQLVSMKTRKPVKTEPLENFFGFSVDKGFREKLLPNLDDDGNIIYINNLPSYYEVPPKDAKYEQSLENIFEILFGKVPTQQEKQMMFSFVKTLSLMQQYWNNNHTKIEAIFDDFINLLWGPSAQGIERNNPIADNEIKTVAYNAFVMSFGFLKSKEPKVANMKNNFYKNYKMT